MGWRQCGGIAAITQRDCVRTYVSDTILTGPSSSGDLTLECAPCDGLFSCVARGFHVLGNIECSSVVGPYSGPY